MGVFPAGREVLGTAACVEDLIDVGDSFSPTSFDRQVGDTARARDSFVGNLACR